MTLPGPDIRQESLFVPRTLPTDTGTLFVVAKTSGTPSTSAQLVTNTRQLDIKTGGRSANNANLYDVLDAAFMHGLKRAYYVEVGAPGAEEDYGDVVTEAVALFPKELGPGQVLAWGYDAADEGAVNAALLAHAKATNRRALLMVTGADVATIESAAGALTAIGFDASYGAAWCQMATIPGIPALAVADRTVPWTAIQAGLIARVDAAYHPNTPAAGELGIAEKALGLNTEFVDDADREALADAGVNVVRVIMPGDFPRNYDYVTLADPDRHPDHVMFSNVRLDMAILAEARVIAERFQFKVLDGDRKTVAQYGGELQDMLMKYRRQGTLFADPLVDVGEDVNPVENLAQGILAADMIVQRSPFARVTRVTYVTAPITAQVA